MRQPSRWPRIHDPARSARGLNNDQHAKGDKSMPNHDTPVIRIVKPNEFDTGTAQTAGSVRRAAIAPPMGIETTLWGGLFDVEPGAHDCSLKSAHGGSPCRGASMTCSNETRRHSRRFSSRITRRCWHGTGTIPPRKRGLP
jgi:hypothetical protein